MVRTYYWLVDALDLYKPLVWEYSRLSIHYNPKREERAAERGGRSKDQSLIIIIVTMTK